MPATASTKTFEIVSEQYFKILDHYKKILSDRFLKGSIIGSRVIIRYKTKGGYFIRASFDLDGSCLKKEYFKGYDLITGFLHGYLFVNNFAGQVAG